MKGGHMSPEQMKERAADLFMKRFHCSQAVLAAAQEEMGVVNEDIIKAVGSFGGGIGGTGHVCGALTGGIAFISSLFSRGNLEAKEDPRMWLLSRKFVAAFENLTMQHGGMDCRDISKVDWQNRDMVKEFYSNPESRRKICHQLVGDTALLLGKLLESEGVTG
jgi:C_GCAxxG_C_C family probable redox protein